jgi:hypothetical protein
LKASNATIPEDVIAYKTAIKLEPVMEALKRAKVARGAPQPSCGEGGGS